MNVRTVDLRAGIRVERLTVVWMVIEAAVSVGAGLAAAALLVNSPALKGDAACGVACVYMAATLLAGLLLRATLGWWWADPVAALGIVFFIVREGREALTAHDRCGCC